MAVNAAWADARRQADFVGAVPCCSVSTDAIAERDPTSPARRNPAAQEACKHLNVETDAGDDEGKLIDAIFGQYWGEHPAGEHPDYPIRNMSPCGGRSTQTERC